MSSTTWYVRLGDQVLGPISDADLRDRAAQGSVTAQAQVSSDGANWTEAATVAGIVFTKEVPTMSHNGHLRQVKPRWPLAADFSAILQHPKIAFRDPRLKRCTIKRDNRGQPRPWSGQFAVVYKAVDSETGQSFALRMFTTQSPERQERYESVSAYLKDRKLDCLVDFQYRARSIRTSRSPDWYPMITMDWVEGQTLLDWTGARCQEADTSAIRRVADLWVQVVQELENNAIAHGDLQHANIIVTPACELKLVDYDCLYVPALLGQRNLEIGIKPYQHPGRDGGTLLSPVLGNFPSLLIYTALRALAVAPHLWKKYVDGDDYDKLLFRAKDFLDPANSDLRCDLMQSPDLDVRLLAERLFKFYGVSFDTVPSLKEVLHKMSIPEVKVGPPPELPNPKKDNSKILPPGPGGAVIGEEHVIELEPPEPPKTNPAGALALRRLFSRVTKLLRLDWRREKRPFAYRLAVYGRHAGGKTCILAAMAMNRVSNPLQLTCTWIPRPPWYPEHDVAPAKPNDDDPAIEFQLGREWLKQAIHELRSGQVPTSNRGQTRPLRFAYWLTSPERGTVCVELIDYSGELIDPDLTHDRMAIALRRHMREMDGFLVLAEAPRLQGPDEAMSEEVHRLVQAFGALGQEKHKGPRWDLPVALLVNKWDRRGPLDGRSVDDERDNLTDFLNGQPEPPHQELATAILNSVGPENFQTFPVSAFGESELVSTPDGGQIERPKQATPLRSFGLEDGFAWAVQRADAVAILQQEERLAVMRPWKFWQLPRTCSSLAQGLDLTRRFQPRSQEKQRTVKNLGRLTGLACVQALCLCAALLCVGMIGETILDDNQRQSSLAGVFDSAGDVQPNTSQADLQTASDWLHGYLSSVSYRHVISRWFFLSDPEAREQFGKVTGRLEDFRFREEYDTLMQADQVREAARHLATRTPPDPVLSDCEEKFRERAVQIIRDKVGVLTRRHEYAKALDLVAGLLAEKNIGRLVGKPNEDSLKDLKENIAQQWDEYMYDRVWTERTQAAVGEYLSTAPLQTMKAKVAEYHDYLIKVDGLLDLELTFRMKWCGASVNHSNKVTVEVSAPNGSRASILKEEIRPGAEGPEDLGKARIKAKLTDEVLVHANGTRIGKGWWVFFPFNYYQEPNLPFEEPGKRVKMKDLNTERFSLKFGDGNINGLAFQVTIPEPPDHPKWSKQ